MSWCGGSKQIQANSNNSIMPFSIPSVNVPHVPNFVTQGEIVEAFEEAFDEDYVEKYETIQCTNDKTGLKYQMLFIHFRKLDTDPKNKNLTEFIRLTTSDRMAHFYYGTRVNPATGDLFYFKTRAYKPKVSSSKQGIKKGMLSAEEVASLKQPSRSALKKAAKASKKLEASEDVNDTETEEEEEEEQIDEN
mgnify:CR=1 FL=1|tara:strand:+ start:76 stop:648 length:573 start_codon:yes stop_codon:yes gene_type:complete